MEYDTLQEAFDQGAQTYCEELEKISGATLAPSVKSYINSLHSGDFEQTPLLATEAYTHLWSYKDLWGNEQETVFPALLLSMCEGHYSYVLLHTGKVISAYHGSLAEYGYDYWEDGMELDKFNDALVEQLETGTVDQFIAFCQGISDAGFKFIDDATDAVILENILDKFEIAEAHLEKSMKKPGLEFLAEQLSDDPDAVIQGYFVMKKLLPALASSSDFKALNLSGYNLSELPAGLENQKGLEYLDLSENPNLEWDAVWEAVKEFPNLKRLAISDNEIDGLPAALLELKQIRHLALQSGTFTLSESWEKLSHLDVLDLRYCDFEEHLRDAKLSIAAKIPSTEVWIKTPVNYPFDTLRSEFDGAPRWGEDDINIETVEWIEIFDTDELPAELKAASQLKGIFYAGDDLTELPAFFETLSNLEVLSIKVDEAIDPQTLVSALLQLKKLRRLDLSTEWTELPADFAELELETLALRMKPDDWGQTNQVLGQMKPLKHLDLGMCWYLKDCESLSALENLEWFEIGNKCDLDDLFGALKQLPALRIITCDQIFHDPIEIPTDLCKCKSLEALEFFGNYGFKKLPDSIGQLINLKHLDIRDNGMSREYIDGLWEKLPRCDIDW